MSDWKHYSIAKLIADGRLVIGDGYRAKNNELTKHGLPFARAGNINCGFQFSGADHFPTEKVSRIGNKVSQSGDVVFTSKGTVGRFALVRENTQRFVYSPQLCFWRSLDDTFIEPRFLYFWMYGREFFLQYKGVAGQTDMAEYVSLGDQRRMHITLPSISDQRAIASVLGALDDKIELNRRMNATLEALAQTLFKSWFVDATQSALPKGWAIGKLSDISDIAMGLSPDGESYNTNGVGTPLINGPVEFGDYFPVKTKWTTSPTRMAQPDDLVFCVRGSTTGRRVISDDAYCLGRGVCGIRARNGANTFLYQSVNSGLENLLSKTTGSVFPSLSAPDIKGFQIVVPPPEVVARFGEQAEPLTKRIQSNVHESRTLAALRDALLPKLLSGELRVPTAEKTS